MATAITTNNHGSHPSMSFNSEDGMAPYNLYTEDATSPRSPILALDGHQSTGGPLPNPPFVFPARPVVSAPTSFSRATGRRPQSTYDVAGHPAFNQDFKLGAGRSPPPLPSFSFNQTASTNPESAMNSPPLSPMSPTSSRAIPSRPAGHRRGGSEFIGGDGKTGAGSLLSTSPGAADGHLPPPSPSLGPSTGRRGHAHRRSAAISCHDLSLIMKPQMPAAAPLGGSAPTSPSEDRPKAAFANSMDNTLQSGLGPAKSAEPDTTPIPPVTPPRQPKTTRVGFSDNVEFIPRPLSLVSSDASSTMTVRQGHSVSGSLSSIVSLATANPSSKEQQFRVPSPAYNRQSNEYRPSTAGAVLNSTMSQGSFLSDDEGTRRRNSDPPTAEEANGPLTPRAASKRYFFFGQHDHAAGDISPSRSRPVSAASSDKMRNNMSNSAPSSPELRPNDFPVDLIDELPKLTRKISSVSRKSSIKQKKVKSWAGSILSRKAKFRSHKHKGLSRRSPTPPMRNYEPSPHRTAAYAYPSEIEETEEPKTAGEAVSQTTAPSVQTDFANWRPRHIAIQDDETMSPIIDLDAALGPFNTPTGHDLEWEASQKSVGQTKRRMHSAAGMKGFKGPGLHYHRRAESAPEMVAFENPRFGLNHIGSSTTMEDVFEEDEEDEDWEEVKTVSHKGSTIRTEDEESTGLGIEIKVVDAESGHDNAMDWTLDQGSAWQRGLKRKTSALSDMELFQTAPSMSTSGRSASPLRDAFTIDDLGLPPRIGDDSMTRPVSSSKSSISSLTPPLRASGVKDIAPLDGPSYITQPHLTPTSPNSIFQSPFQSPRSPVSYDTPRISTATSSIVDEPGFNPLWLGEPGPEIRMSVDDVPSLTSSNSTMTRESMTHPAFGNPQFRNGQRSASLSTPATSYKRSSIASLSRLLSSHGEKSKLSIEERAPESPESKKKGKGKRISRMMQFWKPNKQDSSQ